MSERDQPTIHVSVPDADLRAFARQQADAFFGKNVSRYVVSLIEGDRAEGWTHQRILKVVRAALDDQTEDAA